jgi:hypothetical protein
MEKEKIYIVKYTTGDCEHSWDVIIFATTKKSKAVKYAQKFNRILKKWKEYYSQYEYNVCGMKWIKDECITQHYNRWHKLREYSKCYWEEIEHR